MGQYYCWVNVDRKEYLCPDDFDLGNKRHETMHADNALLRALWELLSSEWKGCRLVFLGDECEAPDDTSNEVLSVLRRQQAESERSGYLFDTVYETYRNVNCLFRAAEESVRAEINYYMTEREKSDHIPPNIYGIDVNDPYRGFFLREGKSFQYVINRTKKICYSYADTKIFLSDHGELPHTDPLPILMAYGGKLWGIGEWVGDVIDVSDTLPPECTLLSKIHLDH